MKYMKICNPLHLEWEYFRQHGSIYGEYSGNVRWEDTYAPYYESEGFTRGDNERCVFYNEEHDCLILVYTDNNFFDVEEDEIVWGSDMLGSRFDCKELQWMIPEAPPIDYLGMELAVANQRITNCREIFGWTDIKPARVPMSGPTMGDFPRLNADKVAKFYTGVGFLIIS